MHSLRLDQIAIVLHRPRYPENIGSSARALKNMGFSCLMVVKPERFDPEAVHRLATHAAADVVGAISMHDRLEAALADFNYVVGTTARLGSQRQLMFNPAALAGHLAPISENNRIALVFGPEDRGLTNEEIRLCHCLVNIPTAGFSSINLAQAVMIICYELFQAGRVRRSDFLPRLADRRELDGMYEQLKNTLVKINYINPENPDYWMNKIRHFFSRHPLRAREVSIIRGICRQIDWYGKKSFQDGVKQARRKDEG